MPDPERFALAAAALLFANCQTTEGVRRLAGRVGQVCGTGFELVADWNGLTLLSDRLPFGLAAAAVPLGVDIGRVNAVERLADRVVAGTLPAAEAIVALGPLGRAPPVGLPRFAAMAAAGAAALAVIFGAADATTLALVALVAGLGAGLRRGVARLSANAFVQPLFAAGLAGLAAGAGVTFGLDVSHRLVAVCPCMVLVPGPHLLNGAIDLLRARIALGAARLCFAALVVLAICAGLLLGLAAMGASLAAGGPPPRVPFAFDVGAAGVAVAAYGSFFNMRWRRLPIPVAVGMLAHALHWVMLAQGASVQAGALAACLVVGAVMAPTSMWLRTPFAALAFASVVSLMPGIFLFQAATQASAIARGGLSDPMAALLGLAADSITAGLVLAAMAFGLIVPKMILDRWCH